VCIRVTHEVHADLGDSYVPAIPVSFGWFTAALDELKKQGLRRPLIVIDDIQKCLGPDGQFSQATKDAIEVFLEAQKDGKADVVFMCSDGEVVAPLTSSGELLFVVSAS